MAHNCIDHFNLYENAKTAAQLTALFLIEGHVLMSVFSVHVLAKHPTVENRRLLKFPTKYHVLPPLIQYSGSSTYNQNKSIPPLKRDSYGRTK